MKNKIKFVAFDADDTLWENELYFQEFEQVFCQLLSSHLPAALASEALFKTEMKNLRMYGYGLKSMMLSMIETICRVTNGSGDIRCVEDIVRLGQTLLQKPVTLLDGVEEVLAKLQGRYKLILATKGDLFDQRRKVESSALEKYFYHVEIMSNKKEEDYKNLLKNIGCPPQNLLMIGNSVKSDIIPVLSLGGYAAHIPYHITWQYEHHEGEITHPNFIQLERLSDLLKHLS